MPEYVYTVCFELTADEQALCEASWEESVTVTVVSLTWGISWFERVELSVEMWEWQVQSFRC